VDTHAEIEFREGPAGRRPGLVGGPDIWEVVTVHRSFGDARATAAWLDLSETAIETALRYYDEHREEIDAWIALNEKAAIDSQRNVEVETQEEFA
jgi:hypothetical protein